MARSLPENPKNLTAAGHDAPEQTMDTTTPITRTDHASANQTVPQQTAPNRAVARRTRPCHAKSYHACLRVIAAAVKRSPAGVLKILRRTSGVPG
jgi:hypothetical protein